MYFLSTTGDQIQWMFRNNEMIINDLGEKTWKCHSGYFYKKKIDQV